MQLRGARSPNSIIRLTRSLAAAIPTARTHEIERGHAAPFDATSNFVQLIACTITSEQSRTSSDRPKACSDVEQSGAVRYRRTPVLGARGRHRVPEVPVERRPLTTTQSALSAKLSANQPAYQRPSQRTL